MKPESLKAMQELANYASMYCSQIGLENSKHIQDELARIIRIETPVCKDPKFDLYNYADKKDNMRPMMGCVYHTEGLKVASDSHILVALKEDYDPELEGKAVKYDGSFPDGKYPNFRSIKPTDFKKTHTANEFDFEKFDEFVRDAKSQIKLKVHKDMYNFYVCIGGCYFRLELLIKLVAYMKKIGTTTLWTELYRRERVPNSWEHFTDEDGNPVEKITEFVPKMCYVESADGASWGALMPMMEAGKGPNDVVLSL